MKKIAVGAGPAFIVGASASFNHCASHAGDARENYYSRGHGLILRVSTCFVSISQQGDLQ
jgi:hypothetical protein